jgi:hypothetical protein
MVRRGKKRRGGAAAAFSFRKSSVRLIRINDFEI